MKVKINMTFIDKITGKRMIAGSEAEYDEQRAAELLADQRNVVTKIDEDEDQEPTEPEKKPVKKPAPKKKASKK
jgi:hypothetical protein